MTGKYNQGVCSNAPYVPSEEEIEEACKKISGGWTEDERRKRHWMHLPPLNSPIDVMSCNGLQNFPQPVVRRRIDKGNQNG